MKNRRPFLRRCASTVKLGDLFVGNSVNVFNRQLRFTDYADNFTRAKVGTQKERCDHNRTSDREPETAIWNWFAYARVCLCPSTTPLESATLMSLQNVVHGKAGGDVAVGRRAERSAAKRVPHHQPAHDQVVASGRSAAVQLTTA